MIYHVTTKSQWDEAVSKGFFEVESLQIEGFIHMSKIDQVDGVLNRYYQNVSDLVLLHVEEKKLTAEIKYELSPSVNQEFPHVFGPININAVVKVEALN
jgi:uncharacterized protein (DUF952 family)